MSVCLSVCPIRLLLQPVVGLLLWARCVEDIDRLRPSHYHSSTGLQHGMFTGDLGSWPQTYYWCHVIVVVCPTVMQERAGLNLISPQLDVFITTATAIYMPTVPFYSQPLICGLYHFRFLASVSLSPMWFSSSPHHRDSCCCSSGSILPPCVIYAILYSSEQLSNCWCCWL